MQIDKQIGSEYKSGNLFVVPYPNERILSLTYLRFQDEGLLGDIYHEWEPSLLWFLNKSSQPENTSLVLGAEVNGRVEPAGLAWINQMSSVNKSLNRAEVGAGFFREFHDRLFTVAVPLIRMATEWVFAELKMDTIWGITPVLNQGMAGVLKRSGYQLHGPIERYTIFRGEICDAWISSMTKERWKVKSATRPLERNVSDKPMCRDETARVLEVGHRGSSNS
jgi:hypothetical protein